MHKEGTSDRDIAASHRCLPVVLFGNILGKEPDEEPIVCEPGREDRFKSLASCGLDFDVLVGFPREFLASVQEAVHLLPGWQLYRK